MSQLKLSPKSNLKRLADVHCAFRLCVGIMFLTQMDIVQHYDYKKTKR